jgi:hypothetical protein
MMDGWEMGYMAGTATDPIFTFNVSAALSVLVLVRFYRRIEKDPSIRDALQKMEETQMEVVKELGSEAQLQEFKIKVVSFKHGHWENGLDTAFKAALYVCSNREEALTKIWKISFNSHGAWYSGMRVI